MKIIMTLILLSFGQSVWADASASWNCKGKNVTLKSITPYMGESSKWSQTLFVLRKLDMPEKENVDTAFFLNIEHDVGKFGVIYISGKNEVGGSFSLTTAPLEDIGDGTVIRYRTQGELKYFQGPTLKGKDKVVCYFE